MNMAAKDLDDARESARDMAENYLDEIVEQLIEDGKADDDYANSRKYPGGDSYFHENITDQWYDLTDAAETIDNLSRYEEADSGLWDGQQPKEAIGTCAAFTFSNAVSAMWRDLIEEINDDDGVQTAITQPDDWVAKDEDEEWAADVKAVTAAVKQVIDSF